MTLFGIKLDRERLPLWLLMVMLPLLPFLREAFSLLWSAHGARILTVTACWVIILSCLITQQPLKLPKKATYMVSAWLSGCFISSLYSDFFWQGLPRLVEILSLSLLALIISQKLAELPDYNRHLIKAFSITLAIFIVRFLYSWHSIYEPESHNWTWQIPFAANIRDIGSVIAVIFPLTYFFLKKNPLYSYFLLTAGWAFIFWLGGRATFISVITASGLFLLFQKRYKAVFIPLILGLLLSQFFLTNNSSLHIFRFFDPFDFQKPSNLDSISSGRLTIYTASLNHLWNSNIVIGNGADAFRHTILPGVNNMFNHPHSTIVNLLFSFGSLGLIIPLVAIIKLISYRIQLIKQQQLPLLLSLISLTICSLFDGTLYHAIPLFYSTIVLALIGAQLITNKPKDSILINKLLLPTASVIPASAMTILLIQLHWSQNADLPYKLQSLNAEFPLHYDSHQWITGAASEQQKRQLANNGFRLSHRPCSYAQLYPSWISQTPNDCPIVNKPTAP